MQRLFALALAGALATAGLAVAQDGWTPDRPITLIVPWAAGGSTDQVTRVAAAEIEAALGATVVVENQPGASGSIGTKNALEAGDDGMTWTAGAAQDLGTYKVTGMLDTSIEDWHLYLDVANVAVVGVNADAPWKDFGELIEAMKAEPGKIAVATAGVTSSGHTAMETIRALTGVEYKHVTYDGGGPAVIGAVSGETEVTTQLAVEQAEMIRAGRIRPLAVLNDTALEITGVDPIPPITEWVPEFKAAPNYFGIFVPGNAPDEVVAALDKAWAEKIANSEALQSYATERGAVFAPYYGEEAQERVAPAVANNAWLMFDGGKAKVDPSTVGIPRP
jgi:tripartite-type tricarboxylate transporter receptor subunit TctC